MGVCARDDRNNSLINEMMVGIRVSENSINPNSNNDSSVISPNSPSDQENPNKKTKLLHETQPLIPNQQSQEHESMDCDESSGDEFEKDEDDELEDDDSNGEPIGDVYRVSDDDDGGKRNHFRAFRFDSNVFTLGDTVLLAPEIGKVKPSIAIIKDIYQIESGSLMVRGQRLYRPEEAEKTDGGTWNTREARKLFYSTYLDELESCTVMHKCIIHLIPPGKTVPDRKQQPGFIVQKFYDFEKKKLRDLTEKECEGVFSLPSLAETT